MRFVAALLLVVAGSYLFMAFTVYRSQSRYVYFPERVLAGTPELRGLPYDEVTLTTTDGVRIHGWYVTGAAQPRAVMLFLHGNGGNISHRLDSLELFARLGMDIFIFDYRGYGASEGEPSEDGTYRDAEAAWRYLTVERKVDAADIVIFGRSLGGAIAAWLATQHTPGALIVESTFTSVPDLGAFHYPYLPVRWLARIRYDARDAIARVQCPVLVAHSPDDEIVPFEHGRRLFDAAPEPKAFLELRGGHNDGFLVTGRRYMSGLDDFLSRYVHHGRP